MQFMRQIKQLCLTATLALSATLATWVPAPLTVHAEGEPVKVGVLQYVQHEALDAVTRGFKETLEQSPLKDRVTIDIQNANGNQTDLQSMSEKLNRDNDILVGIGTPPAISMASIEKKKPIFFAAVGAPIEAGLVKSFEHPDGNVTGTCGLGPIEEQIDLLLKAFPDTKKVGVIYNSGEVNSQVQIERARKHFKEKGVELEEGTVTSTNDIQQVLTPLVNKVDAMFMVTDNTVDSAITLVGDIIKQAGKPMVGSSEDVVKKNGLATISNSFYDFGKQTAEMVIQLVAEGKEIKDIPVELGRDFHVVVNEANAKAMNIDPAIFK